MGRRSTIQTPANEEPIVQRPVAQLQHPGRMLQHSAGTEDWAARSDIFYDSRFKIKNPAASGRGMEQPLFEFFRRPKGWGIYP